MQRKIVATLALSALLLCVAAAIMWARSYRRTDSKVFTTETDGSYRYWRLVSYRGGVGVKTTDCWPTAWRTNLYSQPTDVPQWTFFPGGVTADSTTFGVRVLHGTDRFSYGESMRDAIRPGIVVLLPYWQIVLVTAVLPLWFGIRLFRRTRRTWAGGCPTCGYDLRASAGRCPECGTVVPRHIPAAA